MDGYGTVDSGHLDITGYNEVIIYGRLPHGHDDKAVNATKNKYYDMPHALVRLLSINVHCYCMICIPTSVICLISNLAYQTKRVLNETAIGLQRQKYNGAVI